MEIAIKWTIGAPAINMIVRVTKKIIAEEPKSGCNKIKEISETIMKMGFQKPVQFDLNSSFFLIQKDDT